VKPPTTVTANVPCPQCDGTVPVQVELQLSPAPCAKANTLVLRVKAGAVDVAAAVKAHNHEYRDPFTYTRLDGK